LVPVFPGGAFEVTVADREVAESFETATQRALAVPAGAIPAVVAVHIPNAFAGADASIASSLLGPGRSE